MSIIISIKFDITHATLACSWPLRRCVWLVALRAVKSIDCDNIDNHIYFILNLLLLHKVIISCILWYPDESDMEERSVWKTRIINVKDKAILPKWYKLKKNYFTQTFFFMEVVTLIFPTKLPSVDDWVTSYFFINFYILSNQMIKGINCSLGLKSKNSLNLMIQKHQ